MPTELANDEAQDNQVALPLRSHTILGICEAIGEDFGFNPVLLRVPFAASVIWSPMLAIGAYFATWAVVLASRLLFPKAKTSTTLSVEAGSGQRSSANSRKPLERLSIRRARRRELRGGRTARGAAASSCSPPNDSARVRGRCLGAEFDDRDHGCLIGKRGCRRFGPCSCSDTVEQAADRPPIPDQGRRGTKSATVTFRHGKGLERMASGNKAGFGFRSTGRARHRSDCRGQADEIEPLSLKSFRGPVEPILDRALGATLKRKFDQSGITAVKIAQQVHRIGKVTP